MRFSDGFNVEKVRKAADTAQSPCRQGTVTVRASIWGIRVRLFSFLLQGISRLTLEMTSCSFGLIMIIRIKHRIRLYSLSFRGNRVTVGISRKGKRKYRRPTTIYNYSCAQPIKPSPSGESCRAATDEGLVSAESRHGQGTVTVRASIRIVVSACSHSYCRGFLGGEPPRASWLARVRFRHFPSGRLPRRCHLPAHNIDTSPLWLKTVTRGLFLRCFAPPHRAPRGKA